MRYNKDNAFAAGTCILVVVVTHEAGNLNGTNADVCFNVAGPSSSRSGCLFELSDKSNTTSFYYFSHYKHYWPSSWF